MGRLGRPGAEVARGLGCDCHAVNVAVIAMAARWSTFLTAVGVPKPSVPSVGCD